jgi:transcriptional regulator with XRE-family HTH domain
MTLSSFDQLDSSQLGSRLTSARKARGLTQQEAAEKLQISRPTFIALEKGDRKVTAKELVILAELYGRPISEFIREGPAAPDFVPQFRTAWGTEFSNEDEVNRVAATLQQCAANYVELESLTSSTLSRNYPPIATVTESHLGPDAFGEDLAVRERNRLGIGDSPIGDLHVLLEADVGLRIFFFKMPSPVAGLFGFNEIFGGCIGVNSQHPYSRQMWSLSHEYGHFLTSRYESGKVKSRKSC